MSRREDVARQVLVTGADSGIGLASAKLFSDRGGRVVMAAGREDRLRAEARRLTGAVALPCDIADADDVRRLLRYIDAEHPALDTVLLNAGVRPFGAGNAYAHAEAQLRTKHLSAIRLISDWFRCSSGRAIPR